MNEIRSDLDALEIAEYMHSTFFGLLSRMKVTRSTEGLNGWLNITLKFVTEANT